MVELRAFALAGVAVLALSSAAAAADLLPPPPAFEPAPPVVADLGGWYLRGDTGVGFSNSVSASTTPSPLNGFAAGQANDNWYNTALSEAALFDLGVGYQVNRWFRADITGELRGGSEFSALEVLNVTGGPNAGYQAADFYKAHVSSLLGMVNGYFDLGTWYGITPFVGAGVGVSFNRFYGGTDIGVISNPGFGSSPSGGVFATGSRADLAWSLMAGFDMTVAHNLKLELGYRYLNYGKFKSGGSRCLSGNGNVGSFVAANCGGGFAIASKTLSSNDFRIGLRYYLEGDVAPPPEAPIVRKY